MAKNKIHYIDIILDVTNANGTALSQFAPGKEFEPPCGQICTSVIESINDIIGRLDTIIEKISEILTVTSTGSTIPDIFSVIASIFTIAGGLGPIITWIKEYVAAVQLFLPEVGLLASLFPQLSGALEAFAGLVGVSSSWIVVGIVAVIAIIVLLIANWDTVSAKAKEVWDFVQAKFAEFDAFLKNIFAKDFTEQFGAFGHVLNAFFTNVENIWNAIKRIFNGIVTFVKSVFAGDWESAWTGITEIFGGIWDGIVAFVKAPINSIIGFINSFISAIADAVNFVIRAINGLSFDIPDWDIFGSYAGQSFGLNIPEIGTFQIPLLAKGAVLPANRPFMAIVGDQRHGTNVEAPLATIQEAVALVMEDQTQAIVAGFNASIGVQREILGAVLGIRIGDDVIAHAVDRYNRKMAKMGGYY